MLSSLLAFGAAALSGLVAFGTIFRKSRSLSSWLFFAGMAVICIECVLDGISIGTLDATEVSRWQTLAFIAKSFLPGIWLSFSLTYSRGNYREFLAKWRYLIAAAFLL